MPKPYFLLFIGCFLLSACHTTKSITPPPVSADPNFGQQNSTIQQAPKGNVQSFELSIREVEAWRIQDSVPFGSDEVKLFFLAYIRPQGSNEANIYRGAWAQDGIKAKTIFSADCVRYKATSAIKDITCVPIAPLSIRFDVPEGGNANLVFRLVESDDEADFALASRTIAGLAATNRVVKVFAKTPSTMLASAWISYTLLAADYGVKVADQINTDDVLGEQSDALTWQELQNVGNNTNMGSGRYRGVQEFQGSTGEYFYKVRYSVKKI
jgi:hypothetical protein